MISLGANIVANTFLKETFEEGNLVTSLNLNFLAYLLYSDWLLETHNKLFVRTTYGPFCLSI